jgi:undecaprenyl-diphosphatase
VISAIAIVLLSLGLWASSASAHHRLAPASARGTTPDVAAAAQDELGPGRAIVLGLVEGVTEFLPISSTGHLTVVERLLGMTSEQTKDARDAYAVVIQAGAMLAVLVLYRRRWLSVVNGALGRDEQGRRVLIALVVAVLPALVTALVLEKTIKSRLFGPGPVVAAWIVGGVVLLALSRSGRWDRNRGGIDIVDLSVRDALIIGVAQGLALWPGTSRSLVTILAALLLGVGLASAVEFSFLLGLLTLGAATAYDTVKHGSDIVAAYDIFSPLLGFVVAFASAIVAVRWMVTYLQNHDLAIFGWYRLGVAAATIGLLAAGAI